MLGVTERSQVWWCRPLGGEKTSYRVQVPAAATLHTPRREAE